MSRILGKIIDIVKNEQGSKSRFEDWDALDNHFKAGNDIEEQEYIDILMNNNKDLRNNFHSWNYPNDIKNGHIINKSRHNNPNTNKKVLDLILKEKQKAKRRKKSDDGWRNPLDVWESKYEDSLNHLSGYGSISGQDIDRFINGKFLELDHSDNKILKNPNIQVKHLESYSKKENMDFDSLIEHPLATDKFINDIFKDPNFAKKLSGSQISSLIRSKMKGYDDWGDVNPNMEQSLDINPNVVHSLLENSIENLDSNHLNVLLDHADPTFKKKFTDKALGITDGDYSHSLPTESESEEDWNSKNWQNWERTDFAPELNFIDKYLPRSRHIDEDQIDHIKRHGSHDQRYDLYHNEYIDPKHGAEMFQLWHDNAEDKGYSAEDLIDSYKNYKDDVFTIDDLDEDTIEELRQEVHDEEHVHEYAEQNYSFSDWIRDNEDDLIKDIDLDDHALDRLNEKLISEHDWKGENPDAAQNIGNPIYDALNSLHEEYENNSGYLDDGGLKNTGFKSWKELGLKANEDNEVDIDDLREELNKFGGPAEIDYSDHENYSILDHPDYEDRESEIINDIKINMLRDRPYDFWDDFYESYEESEPYQNEINEYIDDEVKERAKSHFDDFYNNSHRDTRFIPDHLHTSIPNFQELNQQIKAKSLDSGKSGFLNRFIKDREYEHNYGEDQHFYEMVHDHANANGGTIDIGTMNKLYPNQKEKWKKIFENKGKVTSDQVLDKINQLPKTKYQISYGQWGGGKMQNLNSRDQVVFRLDHSDESIKPLMEDGGVYNTFKKVQDVSRQSGHPTRKESIAWARVDTNDPKHWMIDEVQSDFGKTVTRYLKENGADEKASHIDKISAHHKNWREALINTVIKEAKKHGVEKISTHSPESKSSHTGSSKIHSVYKDSYKKVPRQMGFLPDNHENLPLSEKGKEYFIDQNSPDTLKLNELAEAINHHAIYHVTNKEMAKRHQNSFPENVNKFNNFANKHLDYSKKYLEQMKKVKPDLYSNKDVNDWFGGSPNEKHFKNSLRSIEENNFLEHKNDYKIDHESAKNLEGHTYNLTPKLLKKHAELYLEALEKGFKEDAIKGAKTAVATLGLMHGANYINQDAEQKTAEKFSNENVPKYARNAASINTQENSPIEQSKLDAQKEVNDIVYRNDKNWFLKNHADGLSPHVYKQTIKNNPDLNDKYGYTNTLSNNTFKEVIQKNPHLKDDVHSIHYDTLHNEFEGDHEKMKYAWQNGIKNTKNKFKEKTKNTQETPNFTHRRMFRSKR